MEKKYKYVIGVCVAVIILAIIGFWNNIIGLSNTGFAITMAVLFIILSYVDFTNARDKKESARRWKEILKNEK
jgi:uncharacterized membrane protein